MTDTSNREMPADDTADLNLAYPVNADTYYM